MGEFSSAFWATVVWFGSVGIVEDYELVVEAVRGVKRIVGHFSRPL